MGSAAARKAWETRRNRHGVRHKSKTTEEIVLVGGGHRGGKRHGGKHHKGKGMPENVKNYFKWINAGKSKAAAKRLSGMGKAPESSGGPKKEVSKSWGPGNPLYDWKQKHGK